MRRRGATLAPRVATRVTAVVGHGGLRSFDGAKIPASFGWEEEPLEFSGLRKKI